MEEKMLEVGQIVNTHGIHGEVRVRTLTDVEDRFAVGETVYVTFADQTTHTLEIMTHRKHQEFDLLSFKGYENINDVEKFKGVLLKIKEEQLKDLRQDEYYVHDITQCTMYTREGEKLGPIIDVLSTGANDVWVVKKENDQELLIPYIKDVVKEVNLTENKVYIEVMEGLLE